MYVFIKILSIIKKLIAFIILIHFALVNFSPQTRDDTLHHEQTVRSEERCFLSGWCMTCWLLCCGKRGLRLHQRCGSCLRLNSREIPFHWESFHCHDRLTWSSVRLLLLYLVWKQVFLSLVSHFQTSFRELALSRLIAIVNWVSLPQLRELDLTDSRSGYCSGSDVGVEH